MQELTNLLNFRVLIFKINVIKPCTTYKSTQNYCMVLALTEAKSVFTDNSERYINYVRTNRQQQETKELKLDREQGLTGYGRMDRLVAMSCWFLCLLGYSQGQLTGPSLHPSGCRVRRARANPHQIEDHQSSTDRQTKYQKIKGIAYLAFSYIHSARLWTFTL